MSTNEGGSDGSDGCQSPSNVDGIELSDLAELTGNGAGNSGVDQAVRAAMQSVTQGVFRSVDLSGFFASQLIPSVTRSLFDVDALLEPLREALQPLLEFPKLDIGLRRLIERLLPPNWSGLEDWQQAAEFVDASGWPILWLPRLEVVEGLIAADPEERESTLMDRATLIVEDALICAAEIDNTHLGFVAECIVEIAHSISDDRYRSAQALAASVLTELIQGILGHDELGDARREFAEPWQEKSVRTLRFSLITSAIPLALSRFRQRSDTVPSTFNRHAVAHGANPTQFTRLNALIGLIIATSLARELQELIHEGVLVVDEP